MKRVLAVLALAGLIAAILPPSAQAQSRHSSSNCDRRYDDRDLYDGPWNYGLHPNRYPSYGYGRDYGYRRDRDYRYDQYGRYDSGIDINRGTAAIVVGGIVLVKGINAIVANHRDNRQEEQDLDRLCLQGNDRACDQLTARNPKKYPATRPRHDVSRDDREEDQPEPANEPEAQPAPKPVAATLTITNETEYVVEVKDGDNVLGHLNPRGKSGSVWNGVPPAQAMYQGIALVPNEAGKFSRVPLCRKATTTGLVFSEPDFGLKRGE